MTCKYDLGDLFLIKNINVNNSNSNNNSNNNNNNNDDDDDNNNSFIYSGIKKFLTYLKRVSGKRM